jgi:hypothetical protein
MFRTHASYPLHVIASILTIGMLSFGSPGSVAREEQSSAQSGDITLDAASSEVDYRANALLFRDIIITQGKVRVVAQRARSTGLDFDLDLKRGGPHRCRWWHAHLRRSRRHFRKKSYREREHPR